MGNTQKGFITLLFACLIIFTIFIGGWYMFIYKPQGETKDVSHKADMSLSPSKIEKWNAYDDKFYGVYIKYPSDWTIKKFPDYIKAVYFEPPLSSVKEMHPKIRLEFISLSVKQDIDRTKNEIKTFNEKSGNNIKISEEKFKNNAVKIIMSGNIAGGDKVYFIQYMFTVNESHFYLLSLEQANDSKYENILDNMASSFSFATDNIVSKYLLEEKGVFTKRLAMHAKDEAEDFKKSYGDVYWFKDGFGVCTNLQDGRFSSNKDIKISCKAVPKRFAVSFKFIDPESNAVIEHCTDYSGSIFSGTIDTEFVKCSGAVVKETDR